MLRLGRNDNKYTAPAPVTSPFLYAHFCALFRSSRIGFVLRFLLRFVFEKNAQFFAHFLRCLSPASRVISGFALFVCVIDFVISFMIDLRTFLRIFSGIFHPIEEASKGL
ncbi:hypothetical protein [Escherichia coli]|uniref:hypothetical protein n=1 Tax=Escherichia coli TaxID=562 RepID=UPI00131D4BE5|nr:hypothetical protein [Escherichia coli]